MTDGPTTDTKIVDAEFIHDLFQTFGAVSVRRMFGGASDISPGSCPHDRRLTDAQFRGGRRERPLPDKRGESAQSCFELLNLRLYQRVNYVFFS